MQYEKSPSGDRKGSGSCILVREISATETNPEARSIAMSATSPASIVATRLEKNREAVERSWVEIWTSSDRGPGSSIPDEHLRAWVAACVTALLGRLRGASRPSCELRAQALGAMAARFGFGIQDIVIGVLHGGEAFRVATARHPSDFPEVQETNPELARCLQDLAAETSDHFASLEIRELEGERDQIAALQRATAALLEFQGLDDALTIACREIRSLTRATGSAIVLVLEDDRRFLRTCGTIEAWSEARLASREAGLRRFPLRIKNQDLGFLVLTDEPGSDEDADGRVLGLFADSVAMAVAHALLHEKNQDLRLVEERQRLGTDLHDSVAQSLYGVTMFAEASARFVEQGRADDAVQILRELRDTAQGALREMRLLLFQLRPPVLEAEGLVAALHARIAGVEERAGLRTEFINEGVDHLPAEIDVELYGLAQEALNNALKHSQCQRVSVRLRRSGESVVLQVEDDGVGFDPAVARSAGGFGLSGMRERAERLRGRLVIDSRLEAGTLVQIEVPVEGSILDGPHSEVEATT